MYAEGEIDEIPQSVLNEPELFMASEPYWEAFWALVGTRPVGFGVGAIPYSAVVDYLNEHMIEDRDERDDYHRFVRLLDYKYLDHLNKKREAEQKADERRNRRP